MKKRYITLVIAFFLIFKTNASGLKENMRENQPTDSIKNQLSAINLSQYNGLPVDSLIAHLPSGYTELKITGWRSIRIAEILYVIYPNNIEVAIHVRNFQYMNPRLANTSTPKQNWIVPLFRKEPIAFTVMFDGTNCFNGCENKYK